MDQPTPPASALRAHVRRLMSQHRITQMSIMRDSGVSNSVLSLWLNNKYQGDNHKVNDRLFKWSLMFEQQQQQQQVTEQNASSQSSSSSSSATTAPASSMNLLTLIIDVVYQSERYQDCVLWNIADSSLTPQQFAQTLCYDEHLNIGFMPLIAEQIKNQIQHHVQSMKLHRHQRDQSFKRWLEVHLDITHLGFRLVDDLIWDPFHSQSSPEEFARVTALELGLDGEFTNLIALSIRAQVQLALLHPDHPRWIADPNTQSVDLFRSQSSAEQRDERLVSVSSFDMHNAKPRVQKAIIPSSHLSAINVPLVSSPDEKLMFEHSQQQLHADEDALSKRRKLWEEAR